MAEPWSRERIEELLRTERFSYQRIDLPYGLATEGQDRRWTADRIFPADLTGKSVLDLGCNHGYFCFEAMRRGAARAVGVDYKPDFIRRARLLAEAQGVAAQFELRDLNANPIREPFDYILGLNILHHLDNPLLQLDALIDATREKLVLEMAGLSLFDYVRRLQVVPFWAFLLAGAPIIYVANFKKTIRGQNDEKLKFYLTKKATRALLEREPRRFNDIRISDSQFKGRYLVLADKKA